MRELKLNTPYKIQYPAKGNGQSKAKKSLWHGKTILIKKNNPTNSDIPSFEHGCAHCYDYMTGKYLGPSGTNYLETTIYGSKE